MTERRVGPADLLRALAGVAVADHARIAGFLGYSLREPPSSEPVKPSIDPSEQPELPALLPGVSAPAVRRWLIENVEYTRHADEQPREPEPELVGLRADQVGRHVEDHPVIEVPTLSSFAVLRTELEQLVRRARPLGEVDADRLVDAIGRGDPIALLPRRPRRIRLGRVIVVLDRSDRLIPFWDDQDLLLAKMQREFGQLELDRVVWPEGLPLTIDINENPLALLTSALGAGDTLLVLGDLGLYAGDDALVAAWRAWGETLVDRGVSIAALVPCPAARWPEPIAHVWSPIDWADPARTAVQPTEDYDTRRDRLLALLSWTVRLEASLIRVVRAALPPSVADVGTEGDLWNHPRLEVFGRELIVPEQLRRDAWATLRGMMAASSWRPTLLATIEVVRRHHAVRPRETWTLELCRLALLAPDTNWISDDERVRVLDFNRGVIGTLNGHESSVDPEDLGEWTVHATDELPPSHDPEIVPLLFASARAGRRTALAQRLWAWGCVPTA